LEAETGLWTCSDLLLGDIGERGLLRELEQRGLAGPIGDDTAVLDDGVVVTVDALVEGVHFRMGWTSWRDLGYKAAAVNLSDLAAAGADAEALFVVLATPPRTAVAEVVDLYEGLNEVGVPIRGGDTVAAASTSVSVTAVGRSARVPGRAGARPGDQVVVTGPLGGAAAGLRALTNGLSGFDDLIECHNRPPLRLSEGKLLAAHASAMVDLSDGLLTDAGHIAEQSGCEIEIELDAIPLAPRLAEIANESFWTSGEDYELLATVPPELVARLGFSVIGVCSKGEGVSMIGAGGTPFARGFEHFRPSD